MTKEAAPSASAGAKPSTEPFLSGGGEAAQVIASRDWSATPLGPLAEWPSSLRTATALVLRAQVPVVMLWGEDGVMIYNDAYSVFAGSRHPQLLGSKVREGWHEVADFNDNVMRVCLAGGTLHYKDQELTLYRHGGPEQVWMDLDYSPILDESGQPAGVLALVWDTTERVAAERASRRSESQLRAYVNASSDILYTLSADWSEMRHLDGRGILVDASQSFDWMATYIEPSDQPQVRQAIDEAIRQKDAYEMEHRVRLANGSLGWTHSRAIPVLNDRGNIVEWFGTASDISPRKRHEALEAARNRVLELAIREVPLGEVLSALVQTVEANSASPILASILVMDEDGQHLRHGAGPSLPDAYNAAIDGIQIGEGVGSCGTAAFRNASVFVADVQQDPLWTDFRELAAEHGLGACWSIPIVSGDNKVLGTFAMYHREPRVPEPIDLEMVEFVTRTAALAIAHKRLLSEVRRNNIELEQRVLERTVELEQAHESLRQAQKMEAVGQLTGGIAHDFNNMLAVIVGSLDLLRRKIGDQDALTKRYVDAAMDGARRAALLTRRLLAFSRQQPLQPESLDVNKLVAGMSDLLRHTLGTDIQLECVQAGGLWRTHADANQLENAIVNLAVNARDAMTGGGRLTIETHNAYLDERYTAAHLGTVPGQYVLIAVSDNGSGMPEHVIDKAFDPFFTTKEVGKGTGLGLSQIYGFVKQTGGHVKIYSELGQGSTIKVYLPRFSGVAREVNDVAETALPLSGHQEVVLVVEDEPAVRQFSVDALEELGYRVLEADGASTALRWIDTRPDINVMFTDVVMPEINGAKLAEEVRRRRPEIKILFTTGYTRNAIVHNGVLDQGVQMIGKPFTIEDLAAKMRDVLESN